MKDHTYRVIVASRYGGVAVKEIGKRYPRHSVLAGQQMIRFLDRFDTVEQAKAAYPDAEVSHEMLLPRNTTNHLPDTPDY